MEIEIKNQDDQELVFIITGAEVSLANALRRIATVEVPTLAIEQVMFLKNEARIFDEALAHRLGLVPLTTDLEVVIPQEECDCEDYCSRCSVSFTLKGKGPKTLYSGDLKSSDPKIKPVLDTIPLVKLREGEEVELEAIAQLGRGSEHAKWQPTTSCAYKDYRQITIDLDKCEACGLCADQCPRSVYLLDEKKNQIKVVDLENCSTGAVDAVRAETNGHSNGVPGSKPPIVALINGECLPVRPYVYSGASPEPMTVPG